MPCYRENQVILKMAIESILKQTYENFELIIILDDPENNNLKDVIKSFSDSRIRFYVNEKNLKLAKTLNKGISLAQGKYIARMDADDISLPYRLEKQLNYLEKNNLDLIGGITEVIDENGNSIYSINKLPKDIKKINKALAYGNCIPHPTWFLKKDVYTSLHGYREIPLSEDYDFLLRAALNGYRLSNLNEPVLKYRMTTNSISRSNLYYQYLYMKFLSYEYKNGKVTSISNSMDFVRKKNNTVKAENYSKANQLFNKMLRELENREFKDLFLNGIKLLFLSNAYLNKIYRLVQLNRLSL